MILTSGFYRQRNGDIAYAYHKPGALLIYVLSKNGRIDLFFHDGSYTFSKETEFDLIEFLHEFDIWDFFNKYSRGH